jgi:SAM-dependent methyltransferase
MLHEAPTLDQPRYFDRLAELEESHWWFHAMWRMASDWIDHALPGRSGLSALDVGCGTGWTARRLAARGDFRRVVGLEPNARAIGHANRRELLVARGSALAIPFATESFDLITCLDVLQHLPEASELVALHEFRRVLRPGGILVLRSNGRGWARVAAECIRPYRLATLRVMVESAGFHCRRATYVNCLPALAQELRARIGPSSGTAPAHPDQGGLTVQMPPPGLRRWVGGIAAAEAWIVGRLHRNLPFGHSTLLLARRAADADRD